MKKAVSCFLAIALAVCLSGCRLAGLDFSDTEPLQYYASAGFEADLLPAADASGKFGFIDTAGNVVIKPQYQEAHFFYEGLAAVRKGRKWGFVDKAGKALTACSYDAVDWFYNGYAIVGINKSVGDYQDICWGLIDRQGKTVLQPKYSGLTPSGDTYIAFEKRGEDTYRVVFDRNFAVVSDSLSTPQPNSLRTEGGLADGRQRVSDDRYNFGFQDADGNMAIPIQYDDAEDFSGGLAAVQQLDGGLWGYIDPGGKIVIPFRYHSAGSFSEGLAWVTGAGEDAGQISFIDRDGKVRFSVKGTDAGVFQAGVCPVDIFSMKTPQTILSDALIPIHRWGLVDSAGKLVLDYDYQDILNLGNGFLRVVYEGKSSLKFGYCDTRGNFFWKP